MTQHSNKDKILADIKNNYKRLGLELDTLPPVLLNDTSIAAHTDGLLVNACQLVAHANCWTELVLKLLNKQQEGVFLDQPEVGYNWNELDDLSQAYYCRENTATFKEARAQLNNSYIQLIDKITDSDYVTLSGVQLHNNLTMNIMIQRYISELYAQDHFRIRVWKKNLGWI